MKSIISLPRLHALIPLIILILGPLPLCFLLCKTHIQKRHLEILEAKIDRLHKQFTLAKGYQQAHDQYIQSLQYASPHYLHEHLESVQFLQNKKDIPSQRLRFIEGKIQQTKELQEVEENQEKPVFMTHDEFKKTLSLIERVPIAPYQPLEKAPELRIKSISMKKTPISSYEYAFEVSMQLIKREGLR